MRLTITVCFFLLLPFVACDKGIPIDSEKHLRGSVVFAMYDTAEHRSFIYRMNLDGTDLTQLTFPNEMLDSVRSRGSASEPRWSPKGDKIAYSESLGPDESHIVIMNHDGTGKKILTPVGGYCIRPHWNPAGDKLLYLRGEYLGSIIAASVVDTLGFSFDLFVSPSSAVFEGDSVFINLLDSQWHSDGAHVYVSGAVGARPSGAFVCGTNDSNEIFLLDVITGLIDQRVSRNAIDECGFEISPGDDRILLLRGPYQTGRQIYLLLADSVLTPLSSGKNDSWPRWSNDGSFVVFVKDENDDPYNDPYFSNRIYFIELKTPYSETKLSSLVANDPDVFVEP